MSLRSPSLVSFPSLVQAPFVIVNIGGYTFGNVDRQQGSKSLNVTFPDMIQSLRVTKVNGELNTYTITLQYGIAPGRDPNLIDKVLGHVASTREISIQYGDWQQPESIFKDERAIITNVKTSISFASSQIVYNITCVSDAYRLKGTAYNFPPRFAKPSDVLKELIYSKKYGLQDVFKGMLNRDSINELIQSNDKAVQLQGQTQTDVISYMTYLVNSMIPLTSSSSNKEKKGYYKLQISDDAKSKYNGSFFKVSEVQSNVITTNKTLQPTNTTGNIYTIDIGYPGDNFVTNFSLKDDENWAILYDNNEDIQQEQYQYRIDTFGNLQNNNSPSITRSKSLMKTTASDESWWTQVTQFPISANLSIKGLMRPTILMSYIYLDVVFYGMRHISTGTYFITKQVDEISSNGYSTNLELTRIPETE